MLRLNTGLGLRLTVLACVWARVFLFVCALVVPGCLIAAATVAVVGISRSAEGETATVEVAASPREVYEAMLRIEKNDPAIILKEKDDTKMTVSVSRGEEKASGSVKRMENGHTQLTVKAKSPEGRAKSTDLASRSVMRVCKELRVAFKVVEQ